MTVRVFSVEESCSFWRAVRRASPRRRAQTLGVALFLFATLLAAPREVFLEETRALATLQGKLVNLPAVGPVLRAGKKDQPLAGRTSYLLHTLEDKRLEGRDVRLEGTLRPDGRFEVSHVFTVRDGKVYRIRYFCEVCNIEALEPGDCVCCQQPTELQEYPASEGDNPRPEDVEVLR